MFKKIMLSEPMQHNIIMYNITFGNTFDFEIC